MSAMPSSGLVGVSTQTTLVRPGWIAATTASASDRSTGGVLDAPRPEHPRDQAVGAAVRVVRDDDVVARAQRRAQQGVLRGEARREREARRAALRRGERRLQRGPRRVGRARVLVPAPQPSDAVLLVGRGRVDGRDDRPGGRVRVLTGMDGAGREACGGPVVVVGVRVVRHASQARRSGASAPLRRDLVVLAGEQQELGQARGEVVRHAVVADGRGGDVLRARLAQARRRVRPRQPQRGAASRPTRRPRCPRLPPRGGTGGCAGSRRPAGRTPWRPGARRRRSSGRRASARGPRRDAAARAAPRRCGRGGGQLVLLVAQPGVVRCRGDRLRVPFPGQVVVVGDVVGGQGGVAQEHGVAQTELDRALPQLGGLPRRSCA